MSTQIIRLVLLMTGLLSTAVYAGNTADFLQLKSVETEVEASAKSRTLNLEVKTQGEIPMDGKAGAFGYAALTDGGNNLLVAVTHLPIDDSSFEQLPSGFHTHVLDLKDPTGDCQGSNFEVDLDNSSKNKAFDANYGWSVKGNKLKIKNIPVSDLGDAGVETIVSFTLQPVLDDKGTPSHLCVHVVDQK